MLDERSYTLRVTPFTAERIDELLAQVKALNARSAELQAKLSGPPKTPDNSSLPPSRGQKADAEQPAVKPQRNGRPGIARKLAEKPDMTRRFYAERRACGAVLGEAGQELAKEYDHKDLRAPRSTAANRRQQLAPT